LKIFSAGGSWSVSFASLHHISAMPLPDSVKGMDPESLLKIFIFTAFFLFYVTAVSFPL